LHQPVREVALGDLVVDRHVSDELVKTVPEDDRPLRLIFK